MALEITRQCKDPMCHALTTEGYYCDAHRPKVHQGRSKGASQYRKLYATSKWKALRTAVIQRNPVCVSCGRPSQVVDHIKPHRGDQVMFWDTRNLQALCKRCHDKKTGRGE